MCLVTTVVLYVLARETQDMHHWMCLLSHVGVKTSVNVVTSVALCFSMHVGVKTSVNVVMLQLHDMF